MESTLENVSRRVREGLDPTLGPDAARIAARLAEECAVYGVQALAAGIFERGGRELAAMVCEDVEGAARVLAESTASARILELSDGRGLPGVAASMLEPELSVTIVEPDPRRRWWLRRVLLLHRLRRLRVLAAAEPSPEYDAVLVKHGDPDALLARALPWLAPGGRAWVWQHRDASASMRRHRVGPRSEPVRLESTHAMRSRAARGRALHRVGCEAAVVAAPTAT